MASSTKFLGPRQICNLCHKLSGSKSLTRYYVQATSQQVQENLQREELPGSVNKLVIPKRRKRDDLAVLRVLAETVGKDPTASPYQYHDDPYLLPKTPMERKRYILSADSGRQAAQLVVKNKPEIFLAHQHDEPKIEAYDPPIQDYVFTEPSEDGIMERLDQLDLKAAADMHRELRDLGKPVSILTSNVLLEALCYYNSENPGEVIQIEDPRRKETAEETTELIAEEVSKEEASPEPVPEPVQEPIRRGRQVTWKEGDANEAQVLFDSLESPDSRSYNAVIRGMIKHGAHGKAFNLFNEMQEKEVRTSLEAYNALISAVTSIRADYKDRWEVLVQLLKQMQAEDIQPNLFTFNNLLNGLRLMGAIGRKKALQTLSEMRAVNVAPSLGSYSLLLTIFYKDNLPPTDILYDIMDTIEGEHFYYQDPNDVNFFKNAMNICFNLKDVRLAYRVDALLNTGNNDKLVGDYMKQSLYYSKFLHLICLMDSSEAMFEYYEKFVPSGFIPNGLVYMDMMRSIQTAGAMDKLLAIWKDMCLYGLRYREEPVEVMLRIMATTDSTDLKLLKDLAAVAEDIERAYQESQSRRDTMSWNTFGLTNLQQIYTRAEDKDKAWHTLNMYGKLKLTPGKAGMEDFIALCCKQQDLEKALECLSLAVKRSLAFAPSLAEKIRHHPGLTVQQSEKIRALLDGEDGPNTLNDS